MCEVSNTVFHHVMDRCNVGQTDRNYHDEPVIVKDETGTEEWVIYWDFVDAEGLPWTYLLSDLSFAGYFLELVGNYTVAVHSND